MRGKKFYLVILMFILVSVYSLFADDRRIKITQSFRYPGGTWAPMMSPQISYDKTGEFGSVYVRYDFEVLKKSSYDDILCYIIPGKKGVTIWSVGGDNIYPEADDETDNYLPSSYERQDGRYVIPFIIPGKKGTASIEIKMYIDDYIEEDDFVPMFTVNVLFDSVPRDGVAMSVAKGTIRGALIVPGLIDWVKGDMSDNPWGSSSRTFSFSITE